MNKEFSYNKEDNSYNNLKHEIDALKLYKQW